jgi:LuxR family maltose regulon positive regulatory protein
LTLTLLRARALHASGQDGRALFEEAVGLAETYGLRRLLAETQTDELQRVYSLDGNPTAYQRESSGSPAIGSREDTESAILESVASTPLLTPKEREILGLLSQRLSNKQIAAALDVEM